MADKAPPKAPALHVLAHFSDYGGLEYGVLGGA
jgi:hypothetical protein